MSDTQKHKILIADDQADVLKALRWLLNANGYEIEIASGVTEVINAVNNHDLSPPIFPVIPAYGEHKQATCLTID